MRAFVQTFVLAPESPKKYYVHNDIFRYQEDDLSESETNEPPGEFHSHLFVAVVTLYQHLLWVVVCVVSDPLPMYQKNILGTCQ